MQPQCWHHPRRLVISSMHADHCCCRMVMCPFGTSLLVGMASGGIRRLQIGSEDLTMKKPTLVEVSGELQDMTAVGLVGYT